MTSSYDAFFYWLGQKESGDLNRPHLVKPAEQYTRVNSRRYTGKYQMGTELLDDLGYYKLKNDADRANLWEGRWLGKRGIWSRQEFMRNPIAQEFIAREEMKEWWRRIRIQGLDKKVGQTLPFEGRQVLVTESGLLAAAHLIGTGKPGSKRGLVAIFEGRDSVDGSGVSGLTYMREFGGFQTPYNLDPNRNWVEEEKKRKGISPQDNNRVLLPVRGTMLMKSRRSISGAAAMTQRSGPSTAPLMTSASRPQTRRRAGRRVLNLAVAVMLNG